MNYYYGNLYHMAEAAARAAFARKDRGAADLDREQVSDLMVMFGLNQEQRDMFIRYWIDAQRENPNKSNYSWDVLSQVSMKFGNLLY
jgi:hypothetical protein